MKLNLWILLILLALNTYAGDHSAIRFTIDKIGELSPVGPEHSNPGVAGAFSGIIKDYLIIAGGANFPDARPWEGGIKVFNDRIYVYHLTDDSLSLVTDSEKLPVPVAYGSSVSLPGGVLCIGGTNQDKCFSTVFLIKWDTDSTRIEYELFPDLPIPLSYASAVLLENSIYVAGGSSSPDGRDTGNHFFKLDLSKRSANEFDWEELPSFPGPGRIFSVAAVQSNGIRPCIYLFSGRNVREDRKVTIFKDGLFYDPAFQQWNDLGKNRTVEFPVMAGSAFPLGASSIVFCGGAQGGLLLKEQQLKS